MLVVEAGPAGLARTSERQARTEEHKDACAVAQPCSQLGHVFSIECMVKPRGHSRRIRTALRDLVHRGTGEHADRLRRTDAAIGGGIGADQLD